MLRIYANIVHSWLSLAFCTMSKTMVDDCIQEQHSLLPKNKMTSIESQERQTGKTNKVLRLLSSSGEKQNVEQLKNIRKDMSLFQPTKYNEQSQYAQKLINTRFPSYFDCWGAITDYTDKNVYEKEKGVKPVAAHPVTGLYPAICSGNVTKLDEELVNQMTEYWKAQLKDLVQYLAVVAMQMRSHVLISL